MKPVPKAIFPVAGHGTGFLPASNTVPKEMRLTDTFVRAIEEGLHFSGLPFQGTRYDCGHHLGFVQATVDIALQREKLAQPLRAVLQPRLAH